MNGDYDNKDNNSSMKNVNVMKKCKTFKNFTQAQLFIFRNYYDIKVPHLQVVTSGGRIIK